MSIGYLVDESVPISWRGPMLHEAIQQFLAGVYWGPLDYLVVDLPPGTGDVSISLASLLPGANLVLVTTPQEVSSRVAERAGRMATHAKLRLVGVVENMAGHACPDCGRAFDLPGESGGVALAERLGAPLVGRIPFSPAVRDGGDTGRPAVLESLDDPAATALERIAVEVDRRARAVVRKRLPFRIDEAGAAAPAGRVREAFT